MSLYHEPPTAGKSQAIIPAGNLTCVERDEKIRLPEQVATTLAGLVVFAKECLLALAVTVGLKVFQGAARRISDQPEVHQHHRVRL